LATVESIAFMIEWTSGVLCVALPAERLQDLGLPLMVADNTDGMKTTFTVTADYRHGTTTGIPHRIARPRFVCSSIHGRPRAISIQLNESLIRFMCGALRIRDRLADARQSC
jgi:hypothetical protein